MRNLLKKAKGLLATVLGNVDKFLEKYVDEALLYCNQIKAFLHSPAATLSVQLTPSKVDDAVLAIARAIIDRIVIELNLVSDCALLETEAERFECFLQAVKALSPHMQEAVLFKFASLFVRYKSGLNTAQSTFDTAVQTRFFEKKLG